MRNLTNIAAIGERMTPPTEKNKEELIENATITTLNEESKFLERAKMSDVEVLMVKSLIRKNFESGNLLNKKAYYEIMKKNISNLKESTFNRYYRIVETEYFQALSRIPSEVLISKLTEQNDMLKERVLSESAEDITKQVAAIAKLDEVVIKINKLTDVPPVIAINFETNINTGSLINPNIPIEQSTKIIENQPKEEK